MTDTTTDEKSKPFSVALFGTSNGVIRNGYAGYFANSPKVEPFTNFSLGASTSSYVFYRSGHGNLADYEFCILDLCVNDGRWLETGHVKPATWTAVLMDFCERLVAMGTLPIILILPSPDFPDCKPKIRSLARRVAKKLHLPFFDGYDLLAAAMATEHAPPMDNFFRDSVHVHEWLGQEISRLIVRALPHLRKGLAKAGEPIETEIQRHHVLRLPEVDPENCVSRGTSLIREDFKHITSNAPPLTISLPDHSTVLACAVDMTGCRGYLELEGNGVHHQYMSGIYTKDDWPEQNMLFGFRPIQGDVKARDGQIKLRVVPEEARKPVLDPASDLHAELLMHALIVRAPEEKMMVAHPYTGRIDMMRLTKADDIERIARRAMSDEAKRTETRQMEV